MTMVILNEVRKGLYLDSVALMRMSSKLLELEGVEEAAIMMGTPTNRQIMMDAGLVNDLDLEISGGDLLIGIRASSAEIAKLALSDANAQLDLPSAKNFDKEVWRPRTLRAAFRSCPSSNLALISVPGDFAIAEARKAIRRGMHAMIFSDNVSVRSEVELKREARDLGCMVMGPDCGTAIINGTPLAFANVVKRGDIGIVGASGTGMQEITSLISQYGGGISHAIGVGGRDLSSEVAGLSTFMAINALDADPVTKHIVIVSKPPPLEVASRVLKRIDQIKKPVTICFLGSDELPMPQNVTQVYSLKDAAKAALGLTSETTRSDENAVQVPKGRKWVRGLFSGGTLCAEAQVLFRDAKLSFSSNAIIPNSGHNRDEVAGHQFLDLGDDQFTRGRPHPMIDPSVRDEFIIAALKDQEVAVLLIDVVLGYGAHRDPAGYLADLVRGNTVSDGPALIASVTGTEEDPQILSVQIDKLRHAGFYVAPTNVDASQWAINAIASVV